MKKIALLAFAAVQVLCINSAFSQYVRSETYRTEHQRRLQYALDDWISYGQDKIITSVAVGTQYIYFGTLNGGILRYHLFQNYWDYPFTTSNGLSGNSIRDVAFDEGTGYLWAVIRETEFSRADSCIFKPAEEEWLCKSETNYWPYRFPGHPSPDSGEKVEFDVLYSRKSLDLLAQYFANGDYTITGDWILLDQFFDEYKVTGFLRDHWERVWFLIDDFGVGIGNTFSQRIDVFPLGLTNIVPKTMDFVENDLWIGGVSRNSEGTEGIVQWRDSDGRWLFYQASDYGNLPSDNVSDIAVTGDTIWFATDYGVSFYDEKQHRWKNFAVKDGLFNDEVLDLQVSGNTLLVGTTDGLNRIDLAKGKVSRDTLPEVKLATIYQIAAQHDTLWLATNRGIFRQMPGREDWQLITTSSPIQDLPVTAVEVFGPEVWFASPGGVFWMHTRTNRWESFPQIGMEVRGPLSDLAVNEKSAWVATPGGLLKYDRERQYWKMFTVEDGLMSNECYKLLLDGDYIWVTNYLGISQFYWNNPNRID